MVVADRIAPIEEHQPLAEVEACDPCHPEVDVALPVEDGPGGVAMSSASRPAVALIQQRLEEMEVVRVDEDHIDRHPGQALGCDKTAEARTDDHHAMAMFHRRYAATHN